MATIVEYDSRKEPLNAYPERIVSPFQPDSCCADHMMQVGKVEEERAMWELCAFGHDIVDYVRVDWVTGEKGRTFCQ